MKKTLKLPAIMLAVATFVVMLASCKETEDNNDKYTVPAVEIRSLKLSHNTANLVTGDKDTLTVTFRPDDAPDEILTWISSDEKVISVTSIGALSGEVNALSAGTAIITVKTAKGVIDICEVTVANFVPLTGISIAPTGLLQLETGKTDTLYALKGPANATYYTPVWTSSNPAAATVSETGVIHAIGLGDAVITVSSGNVFASVDIEVKTALESISVSPEGISHLGGGNVQQFTATPVPPSGRYSPVWTSSDNSIATVSQNGLVTGVTDGPVTITVTSGDIKKSIDLVIGLNRYDPVASGWQVTKVSDEDRGDGGGKETVIDGDHGNSTYWHSSVESFPHWVIIDMKKSIKISKIVTQRRQVFGLGEDGPGDTKKLVYYISDASNDPGSNPASNAWTKIAEGSFASSGEPHSKELRLPAPAEGRYLLLWLDDSFRASYISVCEIEVYGPYEEDSQ